MGVIVDNDNTATSYGWAVGGDGTNIRRVAQSFQVPSDTVINAATFRAGLNTGSLFNMRVRIETDNAGAPSGTLVDANLTSLVAGESDTGSHLYTATFAAPVTLVAGTTYWLVIQKDSEAITNNWYNAWGSTTTSTYADGSESYYDGTYHNQANDDLYFTILTPDNAPKVLMFI